MTDSETSTKILESLFDAKFGPLESKVNLLESRINDLADANGAKLDGLSKTMRSIEESLSRKIESATGALYEPRARAKVASRYGERYSQHFLVESLHGLARCSFPKKKNHAQLPERYRILDENQLQGKHAKALKDFIFKHKLYKEAEVKIFEAVDDVLGKSDPRKCRPEINEIDKKLRSLQHPFDGDRKAAVEALGKARNLLSSSIGEVVRKKKKLRTCIEALDKLIELYTIDKGERSAALESNSGTGVMLFMARLLTPRESPVLCLELDCQGSVSVHKTLNGCESYVEIGEIKSKISDNVRKAVRQLELRITAIMEAQKIIAFDTFGTEPNCFRAKGVVFHGEKGSYERTRYLEETGVTISFEYID